MSVKSKRRSDIIPDVLGTPLGPRIEADLARIDPRQASVFRHRVGLGARRSSLSECGALFGRTKQRAHQVERKARGELQRLGGWVHPLARWALAAAPIRLSSIVEEPWAKGLPVDVAGSLVLFAVERRLHLVEAAGGGWLCPFTPALWRPVERRLSEAAIGLPMPVVDEAAERALAAFADPGRIAAIEGELRLQPRPPRPPATRSPPVAKMRQRPPRRRIYAKEARWIDGTVDAVLLAAEGPLHPFDILALSEKALGARVPLPRLRAYLARSALQVGDGRYVARGHAVAPTAPAPRRAGAGAKPGRSRPARAGEKGIGDARG